MRSSMICSAWLRLRARRVRRHATWRFPLCLLIWGKYHAAATETSGCALSILHRIRLVFDALHVVIGESEVVADLVHEHVDDDGAERFLVLGPIIENRPPVEMNHVGEPARFGDAAVLRQPHAGEEPANVERAFELHFLTHVVAG